MDSREGIVKNMGLNFSGQSEHYMNHLLEIPKFRDMPERISKLQCLNAIIRNHNKIDP